MAFSNFKLGDLVSYRNENIQITEVNEDNYVSTENLLPNRSGKQNASKLPNVKSVKRYKRDDILISNIRPYFKKIWQANKEGGASNDVLIIHSNSKLISNNYLYYYLSQDTFFQYMTQTSKGTKMPRGDKNAILEYKIEVPSESTQNFISELGKNIDEKIENNNNTIANLEELTHTIFKRWFIDFEFPDENGNPYKSSGGEMEKSEIGEIPKNWVINRLDSMINIRTGYAFKSSEYIEDTQLPVLRTLNLSKSNSLINMENLKYVPDNYKNIDKYTKYQLTLFDTLLVTVGGSIGNLGLVTEINLPSLQNQNMWRFKSSVPYLSNTLVHQIVSHVSSQVGNQTSGSAREFFTKNIFEKYQIALPDVTNSVLYSIQEFLNNIGYKISNLHLENHHLIKLRDTFLPKLISGELKIPEDLEV